jgi:leader peptidase (prepilin peptidase)/N-methyltransferase
MQRRSYRVWIVEGIFILLSIWLLSISQWDFLYWGGLVVLTYFGIIVVIDIEYRLIMHPVSIVGIIIGLVVGIYMNGVSETLIGGAIGFGVMWLLYLLGEIILRFLARIRGVTPNDVALGFGDVNLSGVLGLMVGWPGIIISLLIAVLLGGLISLFYLLFMIITKRYEHFLALPYGPFLIIGAFIVLFFRDAVVKILGGG